MDKSRGDFELYMTRDRGASQAMMSIDKLSGNYNYVQVEWSIWQASRAVEIDLPDDTTSSEDWQRGYNQGIKDCRNKITESGYKFKG